MRKLNKTKHGQVWVETVIYTLIGLSVIGILLAVSTPKINDMKDRLRINEAVDILNQMGTKISEVQSAPGNQRVYDLTIKKGVVVLDAANNKVIWKIETNYKFSEPGSEIDLGGGDLKVRTEGTGFYKINLTKTYGVNLTVDGNDTKILELESATIPYPLVIKSAGSYGANPQVDIQVS
jgi:type II secretory pathway pseudopilin PulG